MKKRLFVGNLGTAAKPKHLREKFSVFGDVENVELHTKNDESGRPFKKFAYLDMNISQEQLVDCIKSLNNLNWKGSDIIVQVAKESYIQRIQREAAALQGARGEPGGPAAAAHSTPAEPSPSLGSQERRSHAWKKEPPPPLGSSQAPPVEFAEEKAFLFGQQEEDLLCRADVALLRHAWGQRLGAPDGQEPGEEEEPAAPEDPAERKRRLANAKRLASLKQRAAQGQAQRRLLRQDLAALDQWGGQQPQQHKRRIVFADSEDEEQEQGPETTGALALFDEEEEEDGGPEEEDHFRLRPHFQGRLGHKALELQSRFAADDRFRLSERFWESEGEDDLAAAGGKDDDGGEPWDAAQERSRNLDILGDILGPAARGNRPLFQDASQRRFDPTKESAAQFELKPPGKPPRKKKAAQEEPAAPAAAPQVSGEQFYEVSSGLHDALASRAGAAFSLAQTFAGQLEGHDQHSEGEEAGPLGGAEPPRRRQVRGLSEAAAAFLGRDDSSGDDEQEEHGTPEPARPDQGEQSGAVGDMFRRMDDHRFATVVDRPLFFFVPGDRRLLEGAKFFRCQSDPDTIRRNFLDGKVALVKLLLSKRKMAKRALERRHGKKAHGSQQWRLGKLRHGRKGATRK